VFAKWRVAGVAVTSCFAIYHRCDPHRTIVRRARTSLDFASQQPRAADGPRGPNAARALCKETQHMTEVTKPGIRPARPYFSSGPCAKPPGYNPEKLATQVLGRSHRSKLGKARLAYCIDLMRELLGLPETHRIGIVPGSDTGAFEMAMWTMLGARPVTAL